MPSEPLSSSHLCTLGPALLLCLGLEGIGYGLAAGHTQSHFLRLAWERVDS